MHGGQLRVDVCVIRCHVEDVRQLSLHGEERRKRIGQGSGNGERWIRIRVEREPDGGRNQPGARLKRRLRDRRPRRCRQDEGCQTHGGNDTDAHGGVLSGVQLPSRGSSYSIALTMSSTTFLASPNTIIVLSM